VSSRPVPSGPAAPPSALVGDLHHVCQLGDAGTAAALLRAGGADAACRRNEFGETPLHAAADGGHAGVIALLLAHGANANAVEDEAGQTALHYACGQGHVAAAAALVAGGGAPDARDADGATPLDLAPPEDAAQLARALAGE
jgi:ankyrin repeat protein